MPKIKIELEIPNDNYCDKTDAICPMCVHSEWGVYRCVLFDDELELDRSNHLYCIRCDKCKQAEVKDDK